MPVQTPAVVVVLPEGLQGLGEEARSCALLTQPASWGLWGEVVEREAARSWVWVSPTASG